MSPSVSLCIVVLTLHTTSHPAACVCRRSVCFFSMHFVYIYVCLYYCIYIRHDSVSCGLRMSEHFHFLYALFFSMGVFVFPKRERCCDASSISALLLLPVCTWLNIWSRKPSLFSFRDFIMNAVKVCWETLRDSSLNGIGLIPEFPFSSEFL